MKNKMVLLMVVLAFALVAASAMAAEYDGVEIPEGATSFADEVTAYVPGPNVTGVHGDSQNVLGEPDGSAVSLGQFGTLTIKFTDNSLTTSGDSDNDLWIFEGGLTEPCEVAISTDGTTWIDVGTVAGSTSGVDIDAFLSAGVVLWQPYTYVRLTDYGAASYQQDAPGADIDAIGAISSDAPPPPPNKPPVADAGGNQTVDESDTVTLDGSNSYDVDGTINTYLWEQQSGPNVILSDASAASPTFTAPAGDASLTFRLTVTDDDADTDTDICVVNVTDTGAPPIAFASPLVQTVGEEVTVTVSGRNSIDSDGTIASYEWAQISGTAVTLSSTTTATATFTSPNVGASGEALVFELTVTDNDGLKNTAKCFVNVTTKNTPPTADAGLILVAAPGAVVELDGSGSSDADTGDVITYSWAQLSGPAVTLSDPTAAKPTFTAPNLGWNYAMEFMLVVTDNGGLKGADTAIVNITDGSNTPPSANAGDDQDVDDNEAVTLSGTNSTDTEDGAVASYQWRQISGPPVELSDPTAAEPTFTAPATGGTLEFELVVTDSEGLKYSDRVAVTVTPVTPPTPPSDDSSSCFISSMGR